MNGNAQASTSADSTEDPLACSVCSLPYHAHDKLRILTSTACGHSYHMICAKPHYPERNDLGETHSLYVQSFKGYCLHKMCIFSKNNPSLKLANPLEGHATFARRNTQHAATNHPHEPYSTIVRNIVLERVVKHLAAREANLAAAEAGQQRDPPAPAHTSTVGARDMALTSSLRPGTARTNITSSNGRPTVNGKQRALDPPAASQATRDPGAVSDPSRPAKRVKLTETKGSHAPLAALEEAEEAHNAIAADAELEVAALGETGSGYVSPSPPSSPLPDSDSEDESRTLAQLYKASQAIALAPAEGLEGASEDSGSEEGDDGMLLEEEEEEGEEVPLDKYGMPPLSQWRRSMAV